MVGMTTNNTIPTNLHKDKHTKNTTAKMPKEICVLDFSRHKQSVKVITFMGVISTLDISKDNGKANTFSRVTNWKEVPNI